MVKKIVTTVPVDPEIIGLQGVIKNNIKKRIDANNVCKRLIG